MLKLLIVADQVHLDQSKSQAKYFIQMFLNLERIKFKSVQILWES